MSENQNGTNAFLSHHEVVNMFATHELAEAAVLELEKAGFDMTKISIVGKDYQTTEHVRGFLTWKDAAKSGAGAAGYWGSFFGGLFGILAGAGYLGMRVTTILLSERLRQRVPALNCAVYQIPGAKK